MRVDCRTLKQVWPLPCSGLMTLRSEQRSARDRSGVRELQSPIAAAAMALKSRRLRRVRIKSQFHRHSTMLQKAPSTQNHHCYLTFRRNGAPSVHHDRQGEPGHGKLEVAHVYHPNPAAPRHFPTADRVANGCEEAVRAGRATVQPSAGTPYLILLHQAGHPPYTDLLTLTNKRFVNPRASVGLPTRIMDPLNLPHQLLVLERALTWTPTAPGVIPAAAHSVDPAHHAHRVSSSLLVDALEDIRRFLEVNSIAFFKRSCSTFKRS